MDDKTKTKAQDLSNQFAGKAIETMTVWADTNQRIFRELIELGAGAARESARLYSDLSRSAIDAVRDGQALALRWQGSWSETSCDPTAWYERTVLDSVNGAQQVFRRTEESAQVLGRTAERLNAAAEQAGKGIQESLAGAVTKLKEIYSH